jgi:hypothetical protein
VVGTFSCLNCHPGTMPGASCNASNVNSSSNKLSYSHGIN